MTETRQDIQAQINQLELDWLRGLEGHKHQHLFLRYLVVSKSPFVKWFLAIAGGAWVIGMVWICSLSYEKMDLVEWLVVLLFTAFVLGYLWWGWQNMSKSEVAYDRYQQALNEYESKRAGLQAELDALD